LLSSLKDFGGGYKLVVFLALGLGCWESEREKEIRIRETRKGSNYETETEFTRLPPPLQRGMWALLD